jgi:transposase
MQLRKLGRHWRSLSRTLSRVKHCVKSMFNAANIRGPQLSAASAHRWFLVHSHLLKPAQRDAFEDFLEIIALLERKRELLRRRIFFANRSERFAETVDLIKTVPGIDEIWGCIIAAEVGPFDRFPNADTLEFWSGLTPDNEESAGRTQSGNITKAGSATLRWALCQAAMTLCQSDPTQERTRQRLIKRLGKTAGKAKANVAMGRRLLRIIYAMMRDGKPYQRLASSDRPAAANRARLKAKPRKETT